MHTFDTLEHLLLTHSNNKIIPGLERISRLLERLGNPQDSFRTIHIVGTNGKGSTGAFISSVLKASGYRTAFYSSPHLESPAERLLIDGKTLSPEHWINAAHRAVSEIHDDEEKPSYFELLTAIAFLLMRDNSVNIGVIEAGLGGRLDATNAMHNVICSITATLSLDHTEYLGPTIQHIAREKFAVIRPNTPAIFSGSPSSVIPMFREICRERNAPAFIASEDVKVQNVHVSPDGNTFSFYSANLELEALRTGLIGRYQVQNASLALLSLSVLRSELAAMTEASIRQGMLSARWPGRLELLSREPVIILDGAHNPDGVMNTSTSIRELWPNEKIAVVYAAMRDKDIPQCMSIMNEVLRPTIILTSIPGMTRAATVDELMSASGLGHVQGYALPEDALRSAVSSGCEVVVVCGSLYLVGYVRKMLRSK